MTLADKWKAFTETPNAQKAGGMFKKVETGVWRVLEPVGRGANKLAGRAGAEAFWPTELAEGELDKAARILRTFTLDGVQADDSEEAEKTGGVEGGIQKTQAEKDKYASRKTQKVIKKIPPKVLQNAAGIAIMTCFRTGFGFSGSGGSGVVLARLPDGSWSPPSGILIHTIGWGFLIGLDIYDVVLVIRKPEALKAFTHPKVSIGAELSVAAGPVGNGAMLDSGIDASPCWSYTKSKGAYAGLQLDGTIILKRDDANARLYGQRAEVADIFAGKVTAPTSVHPLWATLYAAEGKKGVYGADQIPQGLAPGEIGISDEEAKELEAIGKEDEQNQVAGASTSAKTTTHRVPPPLDQHSQVGSSSVVEPTPATKTDEPPSFTDSVTGANNTASHTEVPTTSSLIHESQQNTQAQQPVITSTSKDVAGGGPPGYTE